MKIEIGESLMYSWLRHVKNCELAQTNWKPSALWVRKHDNDLQKLKNYVDAKFPNLNIFGKKKKVTLDQFIAQAETDVMGFSLSNNKSYAIDIAYHENGLGYGKIKENVERVIKKSVRSAMSIYGYYDRKDAEIIFATPKTTATVLKELQQSINDLQSLTDSLGYNFTFRIIVNNDFFDEIVEPVVNNMSVINDTSELFVRSYKLIEMYYNMTPLVATATSVRTTPTTPTTKKVGQIANQDLRNTLITSPKVTAKDVMDLCNKTISHSLFGITYPVLATTPSIRYYKNPLVIHGKQYYLCSQWIEKHRTALENWIRTH